MLMSFIAYAVDIFYCFLRTVTVNINGCDNALREHMRPAVVLNLHVLVVVFRCRYASLVLATIILDDAAPPCGVKYIYSFVSSAIISI
jgi:hypothetical protein